MLYCESQIWTLNEVQLFMKYFKKYILKMAQKKKMGEYIPPMNGCSLEK